MSLDLDTKAKTGVALVDSSAALITNLATIADSDFTAGEAVVDSAKFIAFVDASAGPIVIAPGVGITGLVSGDTLKVVKADSTQNGLEFTDPATGQTFSYVDGRGESYSLIFDGTRWVFEF